MEILTLIVAIAALAFAAVAYSRTGGMSDLHEQADDLRSKTADLFDRVEHAIRPMDEKRDKHTDEQPPRRPRASA